MTETRDPQDVAESLDPDALSEYDDSAGNLQYPPERPLGVQEYGLTAAEARVDEPLEERITREVADELARIDEPDEYRVDLTAAIDEEPVLAGARSTLDDDSLDDLDGARRLIAPGGDDPILSDDEADAVALAVEGSDLSAEEEAVHIVRES